MKPPKPRKPRPLFFLLGVHVVIDDSGERNGVWIGALFVPGKDIRLLTSWLLKAADYFEAKEGRK